MSKTQNNLPVHTRHARVIIDLDAIRSNYQTLKSIASNSKVIAVIKADAYGHGAIEVARALPHADAFAVATVYEAIALRQAGIKQKILVLGGVLNQQEMDLCLSSGLDPVLHQLEHVEFLINSPHKNQQDIWLKFNSGMGRLGFSAFDLTVSLNRLKHDNDLGTIRLMSHLANADDSEDEKSSKQLGNIQSLGLNKYEWGIANSAGILAWEKSHFDWVRAGIALYGSDPMLDHSHESQLKPVMTFKSRVLAINHLKQGQSVGYGSTYVCPQDQTIAVVAAGYADGYPRHLHGGQVKLNDQMVDIVGRVSMDMITINITGMPVGLGDEVILWGENPLAEQVASYSETISYELFCHAGCHAKREYLNK